jgi:hypothetical protein
MGPIKARNGPKKHPQKGRFPLAKGRAAAGGEGAAGARAVGRPARSIQLARLTKCEVKCFLQRRATLLTALVPLVLGRADSPSGLVGQCLYLSR